LLVVRVWGEGFGVQDLAPVALRLTVETISSWRVLAAEAKGWSRVERFRCRVSGCIYIYIYI